MPSAKVHPEAGEDWPTRLELCSIMVEQTMEELQKVAKDGGIPGLCARLGTDMQKGLPEKVSDWSERARVFGENKFEDKKLTPYYVFLCVQLKEKIIILLITMATLELIIKGIFGNKEEKLESVSESSVLYCTVAIIVNIASFLDWKRERMFEALTKRLAQSNLRFIIRDGQQMQVTDEQICVGDIVSFNAHMAAIISCDGILLSGQSVKCDESALTGEPEPISKSEEKPFMISGTTVNAGNGTFLVIAVGEYSIAGKIKKSVYGDGEQEMSPLYHKLDTMANRIGKVGSVCAGISFLGLILNTYVKHKSTNAKLLMDIFLQTLGILACAIPEGLPLALVIALALTSNKMSKENNLVKTLNSCETMGSATTICTDKTGTLTTNRMTVRAAHFAGNMFDVEGNAPVGPRLGSDTRLSPDQKELICHLVSVCTMDESGFKYEDGSKIPQFRGNPTECALLKMAEEMGYNYNDIRESTKGRNTQTVAEGQSKVFTSGRKMMSWAVPKANGGLRIYAKGASEIILGRVTYQIHNGSTVKMCEEDRTEVTDTIITKFADLAMRTIGLAYKDVDTLDADELDAVFTNTDGSPAFTMECGLTLVGIVGIEDPLRPEVAPAIKRCYKAGIDVRMVTGDNLATAIAIAKGAGILNPALHCDASGKVLPKRAMEGKVFRRTVHDYDDKGEATFNQEKFDEVWPYLRVLARSSPDDKLTLAKGLNGSLLFMDKAKCLQLKKEERIEIFPDRQVIAMTGDGTNDAPALKASDVGFAMGIAGTQIAKDAANIILLDDNFASIVVAAKWGRNVFDSIQKFLQFQLSVNIAILVLNVICSIADVKCPLTVLHLLWLNLIMDSAASIALASEPPTDALLDRPPTNRNDSIISKQMLLNMVGVACYQVALMLGLLYHYDWVPDLKVHESDPITGPRSRHYTMLFNIFVLMQVCNEYNARFLNAEWKIWQGLNKNPLFLFISIGTIFLQVIMVQVAAPILTYALRIHPAGLSGAQWGICIIFAVGALIVQQFLNRTKVLICYLFFSAPAQGEGAPTPVSQPPAEAKKPDPETTPEWS